MLDTKSQFEPPPSIELSVTSMSCWVASRKLSQLRFFILKLFLLKKHNLFLYPGGPREAGPSWFWPLHSLRLCHVQLQQVKSPLSPGGGKYFLPTWSSLLLQILTRMCSLPAGHRMVADAISMLRLRFGEPVRFKFIVGGFDSG